MPELGDGLHQVAVGFGQQGGHVLPGAPVGIAGEAGVDHDGGPVGLPARRVPLCVPESSSRGSLLKAPDNLLLLATWRKRHTSLSFFFSCRTADLPCQKGSFALGPVIGDAFFCVILGPPGRILVLVVQTSSVAHVVGTVGYEVAATDRCRSRSPALLARRSRLD